MNNQLKSISIQWLGPTAILVLALVIMLLNFSTKSQVSANNTVNRNIVGVAEDCARILSDEIVLLEKVGKPIAEILSRSMSGKDINQDMSYEIELLEIARSNSGAYVVYLCDADGNAVNNEGEKSSVVESDYYEKIPNGEVVRYLYSADSGADEKGKAIVSVPVFLEDGGLMHLVLLYSFDNFTNMVTKLDFNTWNLETIIDRDGNIIAGYGNQDFWDQNNNVFEAIGNKNSEALKRVKSHVNGRVSAITAIDEETSLVSTTFGAGDWTIIFGVPQSYIDKQVQLQWAAFKNMVIQLVIVFCVFIVFVIGINIISRVYNKKKQEQLESKADTDLLTGLNNKLATERKIKEFIMNNPQSQSMMFIFDIDNFKKINDTMGHAFGDEVLRSLGQQIRVIFRSSDIVGRAGGDEFIVFLKNISDPDVIRKEAKKVEDFFKDFKAGEYTKYSATASIGVSIFPKEGADFESLYKAADSALYKAKKRGKNQLAFYNDEWITKKD